MRVSSVIIAVTLVASAATATAQSSFMPDIIGQTVAGMNQGLPNACYTEKWAPKPKALADGPTRVGSAIQSYLQTASASTDLKPLFTGSSKRIWHWDIDGAEQDVRATRDPWVGRVERVEPIGLVASNQGFQYRALWRAVAKDGTVLGTYDAWLFIKGRDSARFLNLRLYSVGAARQPDPLVPFCSEPGDIELWKEAKAKREAEKASKRAAKEAARGG